MNFLVSYKQLLIASKTLLPILYGEFFLHLWLKRTKRRFAIELIYKGTNIISPILFYFLVLPEQEVVLEADRNNVGILLCTVKATEWLSVSLAIESKIIGIIYKNLSVLNPNTIDLFAPVFSPVSSDNVRVSVNASLEDISLSLCSTLKNFTCFVTHKYTDQVFQNGSELNIAGKNNTKNL